MSGGRRYLAWVGAAALGLVALGLLAPTAIRREALVGVGAGVLLQGPLGWWALSSMRTERFTLVWGVGTLVRLVLVGLVALMLVPALRLAPAPTLLALVGALLALLAVEALVAALNVRREEVR